MRIVALAALGFLTTLHACAALPLAPVSERGTPLRQSEARLREVRAGDTLYSIAWESGRDYRDLAAWNNLEPPYLIKPGQQIRLYPSPGHRTQTASTAEYHVVTKGETLYAIANAAGVRYQDLVAWNALEPPYTIVPGQRLRLSPRAAGRSAPPAREQKAARAKTNTVNTDEATPIAWRWPANGAIIGRFAPNEGSKGIDIAGVAGQTIYAAAGGKVVYQGSGLRGYGQLIIVKHNADFLSAYAHCATIYVQEGSVIKPGQKIAAMGNSGTDRVKLHFEIRRRGVPVDPMERLPKK